MKNTARVLALAIVLAWTGPVVAMGPFSDVDDDYAAVEDRPGQAVGMTFAAAGTNLVYIPVRLVVTVVTAEVGGLLGWIDGGDPQSSQALWNVTDGPGVVRPAMLEGRQPFWFGLWATR